MLGVSPVFLEKDRFILRLAETVEEIKQAQNLRHRCFFPNQDPSGLDQDKFDEIADHLIAIDKTNKRVVGTYRFMRQEHTEKVGGYYSETEFDLSFLNKLSGNKLELGRSCVDEAYRKSGVATLLWLGCGAYVYAYDINVLFGCASFPDIDPRLHAQALSYLHYELGPPNRLEVRATTDQVVRTNVLPESEIDKRKALDEMPALIKGYCKMGGWFSREAAVDTEFNCLDLLLCVSDETAPQKYHKRFKRPDFVRSMP
ncbi:MAG: GNAT family N-acetyltransferase [Alphaproteobacteria bacterium]